MKKLFLKTNLAAVSLAAATLLTPAIAQASDYRHKCSDTENAVAGGVIGGTLGSVIGKEIAGRGDNTEGAILGAIVGGIAGAAIGDGASDCEKDYKYDTRRRTVTTTVPRSYRTVPSRVYTTTRPATVTTVNYHGSRGYSTRNNGYARDYRKLERIDYKIEALRDERRALKKRRKYERGRWIDRRLYDISCELDEERRFLDRFSRCFLPSFLRRQRIVGSRRT